MGWWGYKAAGTLVRLVNHTATLEHSVEISYKVKYLRDPAISLLEKWKLRVYAKTSMWKVTATLFIIAKNWDPIQMSLSWSMGKQLVVYLYNIMVLPSHSKEQLLILARSWRAFKCMLPHERNQTQGLLLYDPIVWKGQNHSGQRPAQKLSWVRWGLDNWIG